jgi:outer membrane autotransporter protein
MIIAPAGLLGSLPRRSRFLRLLLSTALTGSCAALVAPSSAFAGCDSGTSGTISCHDDSYATITVTPTGNLTYQFTHETVNGGVTINGTGNSYNLGLDVLSANPGNSIYGYSNGVSISSGGGDVSLTTRENATVSNAWVNGNAITLSTTGAGNISLTTNAAVTSPGGAISARTATGDITAVVNANVSGTGTSGNSINLNSSGGGDIALTIGAGATVSNVASGAMNVAISTSGNVEVNQDGIVSAANAYAYYLSLSGAGASTMNIHNDVATAGAGYAAVWAFTANGANQVNVTGGTISSLAVGLDVRSTTGDVGIDMTGGQIGTAAAATLRGIQVFGKSNVDIATTAVPIYASVYGIYVSLNDTTENRLTQVVSGPISMTGGTGIYVDGWGQRTTSIAVEGAITGSNIGVSVNQISADALPITVVADAPITAAATGVSVVTHGASDIGITANADIRAATGAAITTTAGDGDTSITVASGATVAAGTTAISTAQTGAGTVNIVNAGTITGTTGIEIATASGTTITNAGTITGTGGTAIAFAGSGNTLTLAPTSHIDGTVRGSGTDTLELGGTGSGTFDVGTIGAAAQYRGFHAFDKIDTATWVLTGTSAEAMPWSVQAGTLAVDATMAHAAVTMTGGTLTGTGTIGELAVGNGATVAPGHSIGTLNVADNVAFATGSTYQVEVNATGQSDKIAATGAATLTGGDVQVRAATGSYGAAMTYTILTAATGVSGTFAGATSDLAFYDPALTYDANDVFLTLTRNQTSFATVAATANQHATAAALDVGPIDSTLVQSVLSQSTAGARQAFDALSGEIHPGVAGVVADETLYMRQAMLGRMRQFSSPEGAGAPAGGGPALAYADPMPTKAHPLATKSEAGARTTFWTQGFGSWGRSDGDGNAASLSRRTGGIATGVDTPLANGWRTGIASGYSSSTVNGAGTAGSATVDTAHLGAYAGGPVGLGFNLRTGGAVAWHTIDTSRTAAFPGFSDHDRARYDAMTGQVFGELGYSVTVAAVTLEPFAGIAGVFQHVDDFAETGGASALTAAGASESFGYTSLGLRTAGVMTVNGTSVVPYASAAWQHAIGDVAPTTSFTFASTGAAFDVDGLPLARDSAFVEAGTDLRIRPDVTLGIAYAGRFGDDVRDNTVRGRFTCQF